MPRTAKKHASPVPSAALQQADPAITSSKDSTSRASAKRAAYFFSPAKFFPTSSSSTLPNVSALELVLIFSSPSSAPAPAVAFLTSSPLGPCRSSSNSMTSGSTASNLVL